MNRPLSSRVLITGGAGFVGSNLCLYLKKKYPRTKIIAMDNLLRRGSELNLPRLKSAGVDFVHGDIRVSGDLDSVGTISAIIDCSAEPSVSAGIYSGASKVIEHNLIGSVNCMEYAKRQKAAFIFMSTSRVYSIEALNDLHLIREGERFALGSDAQANQTLARQGINENFPVTGTRSFYGSTKLSSELLLQEYGKFYSLPYVINRFGVIAGPWQMGKVDQGIVSLWVMRHFTGVPATYMGYGGKGLQVRDVLHIDDVCELIYHQLQNFSKFSHKTFNVGGGAKNSVSLRELTDLCQKITGKKIAVKSDKRTREADVPWYITDNSKIQLVSSWKPKKSLSAVVENTYDWVKKNHKFLHGAGV